MEFDQWFNAQLNARPIDPIRLAEPVPVADLPTPALLLDEARFEANLARMAQWSKTTGIALRPHSKMHKCPVIAHRQLAWVQQVFAARKCLRRKLCNVQALNRS